VAAGPEGSGAFGGSSLQATSDNDPNTIAAAVIQLRFIQSLASFDEG
jgi:hypothetical protein